MPQMMPIYWLLLFIQCLMMLNLIMYIFNSYFIINLMNIKYKKINNKKKNMFKFKWN